MAGPEPSEIYCAAAMCFTEDHLDKAIKSVNLLGRERSGLINLTIVFFPEAEVAFKEHVVIDGSRTAFDRLFENIDAATNASLVADMVRGISAAKAIKKWMKSEHHISEPTAEKVYMTGKTWPEKVAPLAIKAHGFDAYNSSDIIIQPYGHPNAYFGISLKKKKTANDQDPTLINKAFDTLLQGSEFETIKKNLEKKRKHYFTQLVLQAIRSGYIKKPNKMGLNALHKPSTADKESQNFSRAFIDTKGSMKMKEILGPKDFTQADIKEYKKENLEKLYGLASEHKATLLQMLAQKKPINSRTIPSSSWNYYGDGKIGDAKTPKAALDRGTLARRKSETMRGWVNAQLANKNHSIYKEFLKVMNDNSQIFVHQLINLTLKTDLPRLMGAKDIGDMNFGFALVTGIGGATAGKKLWTDKGVITLEKGKAFDIHTILCGLASLDSNPAPYHFKVVENAVDDDEDDEDGAAKVYFDIMKQNTTLFNMELRYKGQFLPQPQFQGKLSKDFITILETDCVVEGKHGKRS